MFWNRPCESVSAPQSRSDPQQHEQPPPVHFAITPRNPPRDQRRDVRQRQQRRHAARRRKVARLPHRLELVLEAAQPAEVVEALAGSNSQRPKRCQRGASSCVAMPAIGAMPSAKRCTPCALKCSISFVNRKSIVPDGAPGTWRIRSTLASLFCCVHSTFANAIDRAALAHQRDRPAQRDSRRETRRARSPSRALRDSASHAAETARSSGSSAATSLGRQRPRTQAVALARDSRA